MKILKKNNDGGFKVAQKIRAINVDTGELFTYRSHYGAAKDLHLHGGNIHKVLSGLRKTILSKRLNQRFTFQKIEDEKDIAPIIIINNKYYNIEINTANKVNIPIKHVRKINLNKN